jgi:hypothetical protein
VGEVEKISKMEPKLSKKEREVKTQEKREKESKKSSNQSQKKIIALRKKQADKTRALIRRKVAEKGPKEDTNQEEEGDEDQAEERKVQEIGERGQKRPREPEKEKEKSKKLREQEEGGTEDQRLERLERKVKILSALVKTLGQVKKGVWKKALHQDFPDLLVPVATYHRGGCDEITGSTYLPMMSWRAQTQ